MTRTQIILRRGLWAAIAFAAPFAWFGIVLGAGADDAAVPKPAAVPLDDRTPRYMGSGTCSLCHDNGAPRFPHGAIKLNEYHIWAADEKEDRVAVDKHHLAYAALTGPRAIQMGQLIQHRADVDPNWATKTESGCLNCHAVDLRPELCDKSLDRGEEVKLGVGCETCHGRSSLWIDKHWKHAEWSDKQLTADAKQKTYGMTDLRDPVERTQLCLSCHVGDVAEGKLVTHEMFAAGHPPLPPFEVESALDAMPPHWQPAADQPKLARTRAVMLEGLVGLRTSVQMLADQAAQVTEGATKIGDRKSEVEITSRGRKPPDKVGDASISSTPTGLTEFAIYDCAACHHELVRPSSRQARGFGDFAPGRPALRCYWTLPLARVGLDEANRGDAKDQITLDSLLAPLASATRQGPFGDPAVVGPAARQVVAELNKQIDKLRTEKDLQPEEAKRLLEQLREIRKQALDENSERQLDAAIQIITAELSKAAK